MTNLQHETIIAALADKIKEQDTQLFLKDFEIERLRRKLAEAEGMETPQGEKLKE